MDTYDMYPIIYVGIVRQRIRQRGTNELKMKKTNDVFILTGQQYYSGWNSKHSYHIKMTRLSGNN